MTHYQALELPETATAEDIRRAYRRLVLLTHPDRTPDSAAHARYLVVNAAYEVLSDAGRRQAYDAARRQPVPNAQPAKSTGRARDDRRRAAGRGPRTAPVPPVVRHAAEYALTQRIAKPFMLLALLLAGSLMLDYFLATELIEPVQSVESVLYYTGGKYSRHAELYFVHSTPRGAIAAESEIPTGTQLLVQRTPLWRSVVAVKPSRTEAKIAFRTIYTTPYAVLFLLMSGAAAFALWPRFHPDQRLMAALLTATLLAILVFQLVRY